MHQSIIVKHVDGSESSGVVTPLTQVTFERHFQVGIAALADESTMRMEYMYWLAWQATTAGRQGRPDFDKWLETITDVEFDDGQDDDVDPLAATRSPGTS